MITPTWIEIPVSSMERALSFYRSVFALDAVDVVDDGTRQTATLLNPGAEMPVGFSLNQTANFEPGAHGTLVYLAVTQLDETLDRVTAAGGRVVIPASSMDEEGKYLYATFQDSEGNVLALSSSG